MPSELPRPGLNGSALVGLLGQLALSDRLAAPPSIVEGLARWVDWKDAIALSAVLQAAPRPAVATAPGPDLLAPLEADFLRVRQALERAIADPGDTTGDSGTDFLPFRRRHHRLQQAMEAALGPLRAQARSALQRAGQHHPALARLAALDAALAGALAPREQAQLALLPALLEKLHARGGDSFRADMQRLLQAELELRLQPVAGLLDALRAALTEPT